MFRKIFSVIVFVVGVLLSGFVLIKINPNQAFWADIAASDGSMLLAFSVMLAIAAPTIIALIVVTYFIWPHEAEADFM